jgi:hypothetical protein
MPPAISRLIHSGIPFASLPDVICLTMLRWTRSQRAMFADKLPDAANLALGALVFGQFLGADFSPLLAAAGGIVWVFFMGWAAHFARDVK